MRVAAAFTVAVLAAGCGVGDRMVEMNNPAVVSGTVLSGPACPPAGGGVAQPCLVRAAAGAAVVASGKDGVHRVVADSAGRYQLALLTGEWSITAAAAGGASGPAAQLFLDPGRTYHLDLQTG